MTADVDVGDRALAVCEAQPGVTGVRRVRDHVELTADDEAVGPLSQALVEAGALIHEIAPQSATLEDVFFSLTEGQDAEPAAV